MRIASRVRGLGIRRRQSRDRLRRLIGEADSARDRKDWPTAAALYAQAVELDPSRHEIRVQLGHACKEQGDLANAGLSYRAALALSPGDDDIHLQIGHLEKLRGNLREAAQAYRRAAELNPRNGDAAAEYAALAPGLDLPALALRSTAGAAAAEHGTVNGAAAVGAALSWPGRSTERDLRARGDRARDERRWADAAAAYREYLAGEPDDAAIRVQLGHALKESGDRAGAEEAYRTALRIAPDDADIHLQLGHVLKLRGRTEEAIEAYRRSFELESLRATYRELTAIDPEVDPLAVWAPATPQRRPVTVLDISDLLIALCEYEAVSGIQRVQLGLVASAVADSAPDPAGARCRFGIWRDKEFWLLPDRLLRSLVPEGGATPPRWKSRAAIIDAIEAKAVLYAPVAGDTVVATGVLYLTPDLVAQRERLKRAGVRLGGYFYDFIPLTHPEFCAKILIDDFCTSACEALLHFDFVLAISDHVASEARRLMREAGYPEIPVGAVPLAHRFEDAAEGAPAADRWTPKIAALHGRDYVLCVGTLSVHKNQSFLVQAWELLVREGYEPPLLVLAGSRSFGAEEVLNRLQWSRSVDGRVAVIDKPTDGELATLYRNCLFTMFPSLVEGWGLPIGESLGYGKLCITSRLASMPEVGGEFALYLDPYNLRACADLLRELFEDRAKIAAHEARIAAGFKPRQWHEHSRDFLAAVNQLARSGGGPERPGAGTIDAGTVLRPRFLRSGWEFGKTMPSFAAAVEAARARSVLVRGWYLSESWGTWLAGRYGRLAFGASEPPGSTITVLLQCIAVPWARNNALRVSSACGAAVSVPVPEGAASESLWRRRRYPELTLGVDCRVGDDGAVRLSLEITGALRPGWWDERRMICIGLKRLAYLPAAAAASRHPPNRLLRAGAPAGPFGEPVHPVGVQTLLQAVRSRRLLELGWGPPEAWGAWMSGRAARVALATEVAPGEQVRLVLQLRTAAGPAPVELGLRAECGAASRRTLPADGVAHPAIFDCVAGADGRVVAELTDLTPYRLPRRRIGLAGVAYGRRETDADRLALAEAVLDAGPDGSAADAGGIAPSDLRFEIVGHLKGSYSLAAINRSLALGLEAAYPGNVRVTQIETEPMSDLSGIPAGERDAIAELAARTPDSSGADIAIVQHWPVVVPPGRCDLALALFAWEEGLVPREIVEHFNRHYRGLVVQTNAIRKVLLDSGVGLPVHMVGCAIDLSRFFALAERRKAAGPHPRIDRQRPFVFLHVSSCFPRKGVDVLLAAYVEAFGRDDPVRLVVKTFPNPHNDAAQQIEELRRRHPNAPAVDLIDEDLDEQAVLRLYEIADAMVLPTRGEGFNMPAAEAMAAGLKLIVTAGGGHADFVDATVARTIDYAFGPSRSHVRSPGSVWLEPDKADLVAALRETVATARRATGAGDPFGPEIGRARHAAAALGDRAAWGHRVAEAARRLLAADPPRSFSIGWVSTWQIRCGIAEYSRLLLGGFDPLACDVTVFCDARTQPAPLAQSRPAAQVAWRLQDRPSMDELAAAIDQAGVDAVVVQHHDGYMVWEDLAGFLRDDRIACRPVLVCLHHVRDLFKFDADERAGIVDALRSCARLLVHAVDDLNIMKSFGLVENVTLFLHGVEPGDVGPRPARSFAAGSAPPLLGAYGFFLPPKGFDRLIRSLPALRARWRGLRLRFVTAQHEDAVSGAEIARCRELARLLAVDDAIEWITDYLPNRRSLELLNECDLVVMPYRETSESSSAAVRLALASRAPVAVTPIRVFDELDDAVLRLDGGEVDDIAAGIAAILEDEERRRKVVEAAGAWLESHDWKTIAARLQGMLHGIVATCRTSL